jgi:hypothetical protein
MREADTILREAYRALQAVTFTDRTAMDENGAAKVAYATLMNCARVMAKIDAALADAQKAPQPEPTLKDRLQSRCIQWNAYWRAPDAHGVILTLEQATELLVDALGVEVEIEKAPQPRTAEPAPDSAEKLAALSGIGERSK